MDLSPLHPKLVHLPIALMFLVPVVSGGLLLAWHRGWLPRRSWWGAVALHGLLVVASSAAVQSGEIDEERVESVVPEAALEAHEQAATHFMWAAMGLLVVFAVPTLVGERERLAKGAAAMVFAGTLGLMVLGVRVGDAGGALVYSHNAGAAWSDGALERPRTGDVGAPVNQRHHDKVVDDDDDDDDE